MRTLARVAQALYRGCGFSVAGVIPYTAAQYLVYDGLCRGYRRLRVNSNLDATNPVPPALTMVFGSMAAILASAATFPMEVYRRQLQLSGGTNAAAIAALRGMLATGGPAGLYRGLGASCLKLGPAAGVSFLCYEAAKNVLQIGVTAPPTVETTSNSLSSDENTVETPLQRLQPITTAAVYVADADDVLVEHGPSPCV